MTFAFLFDPSTIQGHYGEWSRDLVFHSQVLQRWGQPVRVRVGDLLYYNLPEDKIPHEEILARLQSTNARPDRLREPLEAALWKHRIHVIYCETLGEIPASLLHTTLLNEPRYMGCYGVNLSVGLHRWLFEFNLLLQYRVHSLEIWTASDEELEAIDLLGCFERVRHVPLVAFGDDFVDPDEWERYGRECAAEGQWTG